VSLVIEETYIRRAAKNSHQSSDVWRERRAVFGPSLSGSVEKIFAVGMLVRTASDFVALPIDVTVKGRYDDSRYAVDARVPGALDRLTAGVAGGAAGAVVDTGKAVGTGIIKGLDPTEADGGASRAALAGGARGTARPPGCTRGTLLRVGGAFAACWREER
jgi:hypothetical protein